MTPESARKMHWEKVYHEKDPDQVSWWQETPWTSLDFILSLKPPPDAHIIDVGGGDSRLVDCLLARGCRNITVLDISTRALEKARQRLAANAARIRWIDGDVLSFHSRELYDVWHDRAMFHFLTDEMQVNAYTDRARQSVKPGGYLIVATFSTNGPRSCSGLPVHQYDATSLAAAFRNGFEKIRCLTEDHVTPFKTKQNFLFCCFRRCGD